MPKSEIRMLKNRKRRKIDRHAARAVRVPATAQMPAIMHSHSSLLLEGIELLEQAEWLIETAQLEQTMAERQQ